MGQGWFMAKVRREDGDPSGEADAAAYTWAAVDATMYQKAEYSLQAWITYRLDTLPVGSFKDDTLQEIHASAQDIKMGIASGGHL